MCYSSWTKRKAYFMFMMVTHLNVLITWILVSQFLDTWIKLNYMSWAYGYECREQYREEETSWKTILNSCKDKHQFKAVCVAGNIQHFYKLELTLSNKKMRSTSLSLVSNIFEVTIKHYIMTVAKGKKESSSRQQQSNAVGIRPHYFPAIFCLVHYAVH